MVMAFTFPLTLLLQADLMQQSYEMMMKDYTGPVVWLKDAMNSLSKLKESPSEVSYYSIYVLMLSNS